MRKFALVGDGSEVVHCIRQVVEYPVMITFVI